MYHYICILSFTAVMLLLCVRILLRMENAKQVWLQKQQYGAAKNEPSSGTLSRNRRHYFGYHGLRAVLPPGPDDLILCKMLYSANFVYLFTLICTSPYHVSLEENTCIWFDLIWFDLIWFIDQDYVVYIRLLKRFWAYNKTFDSMSKRVQNVI